VNDSLCIATSAEYDTGKKRLE